MNWEKKFSSGNRIWLIPEPLLTWYLENPLVGTKTVAKRLLGRPLNFLITVAMALLDKGPLVFLNLSQWVSQEDQKIEEVGVP